MPNQTVKYDLMAKKIKLSQMNFFLEKQLIKLSCTYFPLSFCKNLNKFLEPIQNYEDVKNDYEDVQNDTFVLNNFFWCKPLLLLSSTYWPFLLCKILKNSYRGSRVMRMCHFWAPICPKQRFFGKSLI